MGLILGGDEAPWRSMNGSGENYVKIGCESMQRFKYKTRSLGFILKDL
jgi:hypothetical protein